MPAQACSYFKDSFCDDLGDHRCISEGSVPTAQAVRDFLSMHALPSADLVSASMPRLRAAAPLLQVESTKSCLAHQLWCRYEHRLELNDVLYLHYKGIEKLENLEVRSMQVPVAESCTPKIGNQLRALAHRITVVVNSSAAYSDGFERRL